MSDIIKYPRTLHLRGSRLQPGDDATGQVSLRDISPEATLVWEEKIDGGNAGVSHEGPSFAGSAEVDVGFDRGRQLLQSRGHVLQGGPRERQFDLFKAWAQTHEDDLWRILRDRFVMYGEWAYARHSVYYDRLPHLFLEFDLFDKKEGVFLSTPARRAVLDGSPVVSVPVIHEGAVPKGDVSGLVKHSLYKSADWRQAQRAAALSTGQDPEEVERQGDDSDLMEGVYLKVEVGDRTVGRYKWIRPSFQQAIVDSGSHWAQRPLLPNKLAPGVDIFASPEPSPKGPGR